MCNLIWCLFLSDVDLHDDHLRLFGSSRSVTGRMVYQEVTRMWSSADDADALCEHTAQGRRCHDREAGHNYHSDPPRPGQPQGGPTIHQHASFHRATLHCWNIMHIAATRLITRHPTSAPHMTQLALPCMRAAIAAQVCMRAVSQGGANGGLRRPRMQVARVTWRLLTRHVSVCARCGLLGCWPHCQHCNVISYCSDQCQR